MSYAFFEPRSRRVPYIGKSRDRCHNRKFAAPPNAVRWTIPDQCWAMDNSFFLERGARNHERVNPLAHGGKFADKFRPLARPDLAILAEIERLAFERDPTAIKAQALIAQQDAFGYTGVWEPVVMIKHKRTHFMPWYNEHKAEQYRMHPPRGVPRGFNPYEPGAMRRLEQVRAQADAITARQQEQDRQALRERDQQSAQSYAERVIAHEAQIAQEIEANRRTLQEQALAIQQNQRLLAQQREEATTRKRHACLTEAQKARNARKREYMRARP